MDYLSGVILQKFKNLTKYFSANLRNIIHVILRIIYAYVFFENFTGLSVKHNIFVNYKFNYDKYCLILSGIAAGRDFFSYISLHSLIFTPKSHLSFFHFLRQFSLRTYCLTLNTILFEFEVQSIWR
jgi:hypothetical protein